MTQLDKCEMHVHTLLPLGENNPTLTGKGWESKEEGLGPRVSPINGHGWVMTHEGKTVGTANVLRWATIGKPIPMLPSPVAHLRRPSTKIYFDFGRELPRYLPVVTQYSRR